MSDKMLTHEVAFWYDSLSKGKFTNKSFVAVWVYALMNVVSLMRVFAGLKGIRVAEYVFLAFLALFLLLHWLAATYMWPLYVSTGTAVQRQTADRELLYTSYAAFRLLLPGIGDLMVRSDSGSLSRYEIIEPDPAIAKFAIIPEPARRPFRRGSLVLLPPDRQPA